MSFYTLLFDKITHKEIKTDPTDKYSRQLRKELEILKENRLKQYNRQTPQMSINFYPKGLSAPKFYGLSKIHKKDTPLHPIVACYSSPATGVGRFLVTIFKSLLTTQKSYIKNSIDLVENLKIQSITKKLSYPVLMQFPCKLHTMSINVTGLTKKIRGKFCLFRL